MESAIAYFAIGLVALGFAVFFAKRGKTTLADQWQRAFALAQEIVPAVEQLYLTKVIPKEQRLDMVMAELRAHFPDLEEYHLRWAVEKAVNLMNRGKIVPLVTESVEGVIKDAVKASDLLLRTNLP